MVGLASVDDFECDRFGHLLAAKFVSVCLMKFMAGGWLAHDFLHHQVFKNRKINDFMGYLIGNVGQGFSVEWWKNKHNTHHAKPNIHGADPDIDTMPLYGPAIVS